ncbi:ATP-binding protein [Stenotrophomonas sp. NPDC087984]
MTRRLLLGYLSLAVLILLSLGIPLGYVYSRAEREQIISSAEDEAESVSAFASLSITAGRERRELPHRARHCAERIRGRVVIVGGDGKLLATSHALSATESRNLASRPEIATALRGRDAIDVRTSTIGGVRYLSVAAPVVHGDVLQGAVRLTVPTDAVESRVHRIWLLLAVGGLAVLTAIAAVGLVFARWTSRPILELERFAHRLADGQFTTPAPVTSGPQEVRSLAATFNQTAARLEHLLASQRAFAAEASHQLKTPLAALRLRLDNLEAEMTGHARDSLNAAMTETDRLARMVEGLLAMARMEESAVTPEPVDLDQVCAERLHTWTPLFERHGAHLALLGDPVGHALAVPGAMEQILDNLLSNALRATPLGSTVTIVLRCTAPDRRHLPARLAWIQLHVIDEGPGMTADQRRRAFDRFWRAPDAPKGGTGLGLSLVQRLAHASGGEATLARAPGGGLDAAIRLRPAPRAGQGRPAQGRPSRIGLPRRVRSDRSTPESAPSPPSVRSPA